ncbi:MAG: phosphatidylglycerol lysyltransferase domain-containing protein, partial [Chitinophagaceae bacterium]
ATLFLVISPFLKGIGAIEIALVYILTLYGFNTTAAASITLLYRFFNFWLLILAGLGSFLFKRESLLFRLLPAFLIFILGIVNVLSGLSPAVNWRMKLVREYIPIFTIHASNDLVIASGLVLLVTSAFLLKGLKSAWVIALGVSLLSVFAHLTKAIDYEEATLAAVVFIILFTTREQYRIKSNRPLINIGLRVAVLIFLAATAFGVIGFYFFDKKHFGVNLNIEQSLKYTLENFILIQDGNLIPKTRFAVGFLRAINVLGLGSLGFLFYSFIRPFVFHGGEDPREKEKLNGWLKNYGRSSADYFKIYPDKLIFTDPQLEGFISYKVANDFAIALGEPVCAHSTPVQEGMIRSFEKFCNEQGLRPAYYRVDEKNLPLFTQMKKRSLLIGQEAIVDTFNFTMEGKSRQNLRTARNGLLKKGYLVKIIHPPIPGNILQQMEAVSDDWLQKLNQEEYVFSQGMFLESELKQHIIFILRSPDEKIMAFLDIIPSFQENEWRYDLIRKLDEAPNGCMDYLMVELIQFCQMNGIRYLNMGMAPLSGIEMPRGIGERTIKFAFEKIKRFENYRGLRHFKEKFDPVWENKYLIYDHHFDLILLPSALNKVMKNFH